MTKVAKQASMRSTETLAVLAFPSCAFSHLQKKTEMNDFALKFLSLREGSIVADAERMRSVRP